MWARLSALLRITWTGTRSSPTLLPEISPTPSTPPHPAAWVSDINSGDGGSPVRGTIISHNVIRDEDVDIAVNTPAEVDIHLNDLLGGKVGVADVCALDASTICTGLIDASENFWGCSAGPGGHERSTASGSDIRFTP